MVQVELTWDEEDQSKVNAMKEAFSKVDTDEVGAMDHLIGSASESDEEEEEAEDRGSINKYRWSCQRSFASFHIAKLPVSDNFAEKHPNFR